MSRIGDAKYASDPIPAAIRMIPTIDMAFMREPRFPRGVVAFQPWLVIDGGHVELKGQSLAGKESGSRYTGVVVHSW
jgi:hypothetical protein